MNNTNKRNYKSLGIFILSMVFIVGAIAQAVPANEERVDCIKVKCIPNVAEYGTPAVVLYVYKEGLVELISVTPSGVVVVYRDGSVEVSQ